MALAIFWVVLADWVMVQKISGIKPVQGKGRVALRKKR
jgi:hypothetical protein